MKRLFVILLMIFMLTACAAEKPQPKQEEPVAEPEITEGVVQTEEEPEKETEEPEREPQPEEDAVEYTSLMVEDVVEDSVGYSFEVPQFDCPGSERIYAYFDKLALDMRNYTKDVVYENAMERSCIVSVYGRVDSATAEGDILSVTYSYTCQYSDTDEPEVDTTVLRFDMITGEMVE